MDQTNLGFIYYYHSVVPPGDDENPFSRFLSMCHSYVPGQWVSLCLGIKNKNDSQQILMVQNGKKCSDNTFNDGKFGAIEFLERITIADM